MDVDVLTAEERLDLMKKGACFRCKAQGHLSRDCVTVQLVVYSLLSFHSYISFTPVPVSTAPCFLLTLFIYFIRGCAPHLIIMLNHDDSILLLTL